MNTNKTFLPILARCLSAFIGGLIPSRFLTARNPGRAGKIEPNMIKPRFPILKDEARWQPR